MQRALELADHASSHGDVPVGCVVVSAEGTLLGAGENRRELDRDPTAHAEVLALGAAARHVGHWRLDGATVFVTLEPCAMCAGALVNARVARVVFGASDGKAGAVVSLFGIGRDIRLNHRFVVQGGLLADESSARLSAFFQHLRARKPG